MATPHARMRPLQRILDLCLASSGLALSSPWLFVQALRSRLRRGSTFERTMLVGRSGRPFVTRRFTADVRGRDLPILFEILLGHRSFVGPRPWTPWETHELARPERFRVRPGWLTPYSLQRRARLCVESEEESDMRYARDAHVGTDLFILLRSIAGTIFGWKGTVKRDASSHHAILGVTFANTTMRDTLTWIETRARARRSSTIAFVNPDCLNIACRHPAYRDALRDFDRVLPDGVGLIVAGRILGFALRENVNGTDLLPHLCELACAKGLALFLLGARPGVAEEAARRLVERHEGLRIAGYHHGYFDPADTESVLARIRASRADLVLIGFGAPRQELFIQEHRHALGHAVVLGIGGLLDFASGGIPRAPLWLRELGLEWLWRLSREPRRMWRRYVLGNPLFLLRVLRQRFGGYLDTKRQGRFVGGNPDRPSRREPAGRDGA
ncbi:MAG: WecB/TagA/CpsF family glycosyltransferase [Planctomycetes bacterium]|nr:WecB/TagA/CpsF family glycosyltransferase [Planctomycetota bacterium]